MTRAAVLTACAALAVVVIIGATAGGCAGPHVEAADTWADVWATKPCIPGVERPFTAAERAKLRHIEEAM